jgi:hypothetical protein
MELGGLQESNKFGKQAKESQKNAESSAAFGKIFNQKADEVKQLQRIAPSEMVKKSQLKDDKDDIEDGEFLDAEDAEDALFEKKMTRLKNTTARHLDSMQRQILD